MENLRKFLENAREANSRPMTLPLSYEQEAKKTYEAYRKQMNYVNRFGLPMVDWEELSQSTRDHWIFAVRIERDNKGKIII